MKPKSEFDQYVSAAVHQKRIAQDITQADLAIGIGVTDGFISQVESPKSPSKYNLNHLNKIAKYLECSPRDFLPEKPL